MTDEIGTELYSEEDLTLSIFERLTLSSMALNTITSNKGEGETVDSLIQKVGHVNTVLMSIISEIVAQQRDEFANVE